MASDGLVMQVPPLNGWYWIQPVDQPGKWKCRVPKWLVNERIMRWRRGKENKKIESKNFILRNRSSNSIGEQRIGEPGCTFLLESWRFPYCQIYQKMRRLTRQKARIFKKSWYAGRLHPSSLPIPSSSIGSISFLDKGTIPGSKRDLCCKTHPWIRCSDGKEKVWHLSLFYTLSGTGPGFP